MAVAAGAAFLEIALAFSAVADAEQAAVAPDWENPAVIGVTKVSARAPFVLPGEKQNDPRVASLNGMWRFGWSPAPRSRPADFYSEDFSTNDWARIRVPGNWQMQGFGMPTYRTPSFRTANQM
ncbi:MAG: hypothetical protein CMJ58_10240 [Planctomycetaceae bacterium]|nr:hypothetical protein [Planctomycetaceae bacterium]